jgi:hypothetical protein
MYSGEIDIRDDRTDQRSISMTSVSGLMGGVLDVKLGRHPGSVE